MKKAKLSDEVQNLVSDSAEALIRFYSEAYAGETPNKIFVDAHMENMKEALKDHGVLPDVFTAALVQTLCMTIINMCEESEDDD